MQLPSLPVRRKNRGGDITPIRLRSKAVSASPARPSRPSPAVPAAVCPAPPSRPRLPRSRRVRPVKKSRTGCAGAADGRPSAQAHRGRVLVANPVSEWPFGSPLVRKGRTTKNRRPDRRTRRQVTACLPTVARLSCRPVTASLLTSVHYCPALLGIARVKRGAEQVSTHHQPFSGGLTTSAVSRSSRRPPASFRCGERKMNPC